MELNNISARVTLNTDAFSQGLRRMLLDARRTGREVQNALGGSGGGGIPLRPPGRGGFADQDRLVNRFRDIQRIVGGILISQAFYRAVNAIQSASGAVVDFSMNMEVAYASFTRLLGTEEKAKGFIAVMKDFAALTPYSTEQTLEMSRRLMAMGFEAEKVKGVMTIITDATAALGGDSQKLERIVLALGQMKTNGKVAAQEIRQLAEAGIDARKILQEELGLTVAQIRKIGDLNIDGQIGVQAILKGLEKRFKGMNEIIANTMQGMLTTIKDDILLLSEEIGKTPYKIFKNYIKGLRDGLEGARKIVDKSGIGGLFESITPKYLQEPIRLIIASVKSLIISFKLLSDVIGPILSQVLGAFVVVAAKILPPIAALIRGIVLVTAALVKAIAPIKWFMTALVGLMVVNAVGKAMMVFFSILRVAAIAAWAASMIKILAQAIASLTMILARNPITALIMVIAAALLYLALNSKLVAGWLDIVGAKLQKIAGINIGDLLTPKTEDIEKLKEEYNKALDLTSANLKDVGKNAKDAGKKVKDSFVASFDELYQIPENLDGVNDSLEDLPDTDIPDFKIPDVKLPDIPKVEDLIKKWIDDLKIPEIPIVPIPAKDNRQGPPKPPPDNDGPPDEPPTGYAVVTKALETIETLIARLRNSAIIALQVTIDNVALPVLERIDKTIESIRRGANIAIVTVVNDVALPVLDSIYKAVKSIKDLMPIAISVTIPLLETLNKEVLEPIKNFCTVTVPAEFEQLTKWLGENWKTALIGVLVAIAAVIAFVFGGEIIAAVGAAAAAFGSFVTGLLAGIPSVSAATGSISVAFAVGMAAVVTALALVGTKLDEIGTAISIWSSETYTDISVWSSETYTTISTWVSDTLTSFGEWLTKTYTNFGIWTSNTATNFGTWSSTSLNTINTWVSDSADAIYNWVTNTGTNMANWVNTSISGIGEWATKTGDSFTQWINGTSKGMADWVTNVLGNFGVFVTNGTAAVNSWAKTAWSSMGSWLSGTASSIGSWASSTIDTIVGWASSAYNAIASLASSVGESIGKSLNITKGSISNAYTGMGNWVDKNSNWLAPMAIGALTVGAIAATVATGGLAAAPAAAAIALAGSAGAAAASGSSTRGKVLGLERGGIVNKEGFILAGENDKAEAMVPLENPNYMRPFAQAIARELEGSSTRESVGSNPIVYVHTLIADERGLKELERKLNMVRLSEDTRKGVIR